MKRMLALVPLALAMGCGGYTIPAQHVAAPQGSIQKADQMGVAYVSPQAAERLAVAKQELASARRLHRDGEDRHADLMYLRADADARVAITMAREQILTAQAKTVQDQARALGSAPGGR